MCLINIYGLLFANGRKIDTNPCPYEVHVRLKENND